MASRVPLTNGHADDHGTYAKDVDGTNRVRGTHDPQDFGLSNGLNGVTPSGASAESGQLKKASIENCRRMRVVVIGAGFSGIYLGIRIPERLHNVDLTIYDKNDGVGGTWWENRYPGCACDIPAHSYVYTFEPNPDWKNFYASAADIQGYLERACKKYSADRFIKLSHKVTKAEWRPEAAKWFLEIQEVNSGQRFTDEADVVINARGALNDPAWPEIDGLRSFEGKLVHSAIWDTDFDYSNKRVGIIGSGSSSIQIVPAIQKLPGTQLSCFIRSQTWIAPPFGEETMHNLHMEHTNFSDEEKRKFHADPAGYHAFRKRIESDGNNAHGAFYKGSKMGQEASDFFTKQMKSRLARKPGLADRLIPKFSVGCRRLTPGPGFLEALCEDNVDFISTGIAKVNASGIELEDGKQVDLDVLVCATGFNAMAAPPFPVIGLNGQSMQERFEPYPEAYLSLVVDGFPNMYTMMGPNSAIVFGSLTKMIESMGDYVVKAVRKQQKEDIRSMVIKKEAVADWSEYIDNYFPGTVHLDECRSWYRNEGGRGPRIMGIWPGSTLHAVEALRSPRWEDFEYEYETKNRMRWLGYGWTDLQLQTGDLSYYIEKEFVDFPQAPRPEENYRYKTLAWSY